MENTSFNGLQDELQFYRDNQTVVEQEIRTLISDNQKLSQQVGELLKEKLENARNIHDKINGNEVEELKRQIVLLAKERDSLHVLWQTSQKTIDALEIELKAYQGYVNGDNQSANEQIRDLQLKLDTALTDYIELETKYKELQTKCNVLENDNKIKEKEALFHSKKGKQLQDKLEELTKTLEEYKINLAVETKYKDDLERRLDLLQKECIDRTKKEMEAKSKVAEALQLFDKVITQKNEAQKKLSQITAELFRVKQNLLNVKHDTESVYRSELDELRDKYNEKISDMLEHIRNLDAELIEKGLMLNKSLREIKILQEANEEYSRVRQDLEKSVDPKLALAEQRLEAMLQELILSERRNIQLVCEKQCLAIDMQRVQDNHNRETKRRDWEENLLRTQCEELRAQIEHLTKSLDDTHSVINKLQNMLTSRKELNEKMVTTKSEELLELNKHLENQMELSKKWKESYIEMTEKLKRKLEEMQMENKELRSKLKLPSTGSISYEEDSA